MLPSNLDSIGAGALAQGRIPVGARLEHPIPLPKGTPLGQHLRIERLVRLVDGRQLYLANNVDPLWAHKKCWHCGNRYNPNQAQACGYCGTPLREQRFLATVRHDRSQAAGWEAWLKLRVSHPAINPPVAAFYRDSLPVTVFAYYGETLLADLAAPLPAASIVPIAHRLAVALQAIHTAGVRLAPWSLANIVLMPDGSPRLTDLVAAQVLDEASLARHPERPLLNDVRHLCGALLPLVDPTALPLVAFLQAGLDGHHGPLRRFCAALERLELAAPSSIPSHAAFSDVGLLRKRNEDAWAWRQVGNGGRLYVVADGMGGHDDGHLASAIAVRAVGDRTSAALQGSATSETFLKQALADAVRAAHAAVRAEASGHPRGMGTTVAALLLLGGLAVVAHAGDSRIYLRRGPTLDRRTFDHSLVQAMVERGTITESEARTHPKAGVLLNYLGLDDEVDVDVAATPTQAGDRWLLCTDGLWGELSDQQLRWALDTYQDPRQVVVALVREALAAGARDNLSIIVVDAEPG